MEPKLRELIKKEEKRQQESLQMIPSENWVSEAVREASGSVLTNKYSEGYPGRRYYQGNRLIDEVENLAIERAKKLFGVPHVNVQPYSGSPANSAVYFALADVGDTIMGLKLASGGHLTHGQPQVTFSGRYFRSAQFGLDEKGLLDYDEIERLAHKERPKVMMVGTTAYPLAFNWRRFGQIADSVGAYLCADIAHLAGLVLAGAYPDPAPYTHLITTTTHKTLRGPRGAMIMVTRKGLRKDPELASKIDKAVFPGLQGGPHNHTTAALAQALYEAGRPEFKRYAQQIVKNAKALAKALKKRGFSLVAGGTECHLLVVDFRPQGLSGKPIAEALEVAGIVCNYNTVPNDPLPPFYGSGIRLGTPWLTTRGMREAEMDRIADWIARVVRNVKGDELPEEPEKRGEFMKKFRSKITKDKALLGIAKEVKGFAKKFPAKL